LTSLSHPCKFQQVSRLGSVTARHLVVGVSQTLRRWTEGATYIRQGDHHVGHWPTFLVLHCITLLEWQTNFIIKLSVRTGCAFRMCVLVHFQWYVSIIATQSITATKHIKATTEHSTSSWKTLTSPAMRPWGTPPSTSNNLIFS